MATHLVLVFQISLELHQIVNQNVLSIQIVQVIKHAYGKNVEILVLDLVAHLLSAA